MNNWLYFYQHLPQRINPTISFGFFSVSWYSIMYLVGFVTVYMLIRYRINNAEYENFKISNSKLQFPNKIQNPKSKYQNVLFDFLIYAFVGLIIGARLGEVFFYNLSYYIAYPWQIISPFDPVTNEFIGIYGMSYHGGLIGVIIATLLFCRQYKINFFSWANFIVPAIPLGYFFGRIGNFLNGELYGRVTSRWWGMYFSDDSMVLLRHPSQLYEAILEGLILFTILWPIRNKKWARENIMTLYVSGYAIARIVSEFFRQPDGYIGPLTLGQFYSFLMILVAFGMFLNGRKRWYN